MNVGLKPTNDPNYTNSAKEASRYDFNNSSKYENLYQGLINSLKTGVENADATVKGMIKSDVYEGVDKLRGAQGVDVAADNPLTPLNLDKGGPAAVAGTQGPSPEGQGGPGGATGGGGAIPLADNRPPNVDAVQSDVQRLYAANKQGKISDSNYYAQLETMTRALRSRYPGYRDEVDAMVASVTGVTPANALRKSLLSDMATAQSQADADAKEWRTFVTNHAAYIPPWYWDKVQKGEPVNQNQIRSIVAAKLRDENDVKASSASMENASKRNSLQSSEVEGQLIKHIGSIANSAFYDISSNDGVAKIMRDVTERIASNKPYNDQERMALSAQVQQLEYNIRAGMEKASNSPMWEGGPTYASALRDEGKRNKIIDDALKPISMLKDALINDKLGAFAMAANGLKQSHDANVKKIYDSSGYYKAVDAINTFSPEMVKILATRPNNPLGASEGVKATLGVFRVLDATGGRYSEDGTTSWKQQLKTLKDMPDGKKAKSIEGFITDKVDLLTNPGITDEARANIARVAFHPDNKDFLTNFDIKSQGRIFSMLVNPKTTEMMARLGDKQIWRDYSDWAASSFGEIFKATGDEINRANDTNWVNVRWDAGTKRFKAEPTPEGIKAISNMSTGVGGNVLNAIEAISTSGIPKAVDRINTALDSIEPILKANGHDTATEMRNLTNFVNINDQKNTGWWGRLLDSVNTNEEIINQPPTLNFGGKPMGFTQPSGGNGSTGGRTVSIDVDSPTLHDDLKKAFAGAESSNDYNRLVTPASGKYTTAPLTNMTIGQVLEYQDGMRGAGFPSTAAGKFQIIQGTLKSLVKDGVIKLTDKYSPENQEKLAEALLERRGLSDFMAGKMSHRQFLTNLGSEWEAIKRFPEVGKRVLDILKEARK